VVVTLAPQLRDIFSIDQVSLNTDHVAVSSDAARYNCAHVQFFPDLARINFLTFVAGNHATWHNT
jgi:hypothetical protein